VKIQNNLLKVHFSLPLWILDLNFLHIEKCNFLRTEVNNVLINTGAKVSSLTNYKQGLKAFIECGANFFSLILISLKESLNKVQKIIKEIRDYEKIQENKAIHILILSGKLI
jgi:hypothetical protein